MTKFQGNRVRNNEVIGFLERHRRHHLYQSNLLNNVGKEKLAFVATIWFAQPK